MISLKIKTVGALAAAALLLLAALAFLAREAVSMRYNDLLLATPLKPGTAGPDTENLEQFCEDEFLVTYEIRQEKTARAINSGHPVTVIGTNACYQNVLNYAMLDGGFFTKTAWDANSRHAVLNETAAFKLFGSKNISGKTMRIGEETWLVTGVIQDGDEDNANVYVPSGATGGRPQSLMALLGGGVTEAYAKTALKSLGIHDNAYKFYNLSKLASMYGERFDVAWKTAAMLLAVFIAVRSALNVSKRLRSMKKLLNNQYLTELAASRRADMVKAAGMIILLVACIAASLVLSVQILDICLGWLKLPSEIGTAYDFALKVQWLRDYHQVGIAIFAAFLCAAVSAFAISLAKPVRE